MKTLKLSSIYSIGLGFLVITLLIGVLSFSYIYLSTEKILTIINLHMTEHNDLPLSHSTELFKSVDEIDAIRTKAYVLFSFALLLSSAGAIFIFSIYKKNIMEPSLQISSAMQKMTQGEFEKLKVGGGTEISVLADRFNVMMQTLQDEKKELQDAISKEQNVVRKLNVLNELNSSLIFKLSVSEVLESIISFSNPLIKSEIKTIALINRLTRQTSHFTSSLPKDYGDVTLMTNNIIRELFINKWMPIRLNVSSGDKRFAGIIEGVNLKINNFLAVPIMIGEDILGAFILVNKTGGDEFTAEDEDTALMVSFHGSAAIEKALLHEKTVELAKTDGLTGLNNHRTFHETLEEEIQRARRFDRNLSLLLIDIDYFKKFNDTYGHQEGDSALKELAGILSQNLRSIDSAARYGGEEFTIILPETLLEGALNTAERISNEVKKHSFDIMGNKAHITVSIGVSTFPDDAMDREGLIKAADDALYMSKRKGRNAISTFRQYKIESAGATPQS